MEKSQIITKEKLQFSGMMKEALRIPFKNPNLILFFLLASLSLFSFLLLSEIIFLQSLIQILDLLMEYFPRHYGGPTGFDSWQPMYSIREMIGSLLSSLLSSLLLLGIIHLLDLVNTIITVYAASVIYTGEANNPMNLKQIISTPIKKSHKGRIGLNVVEMIGGKVFLDCVGNFMMWVGFVVYYYDCKKRFLEKKFDAPDETVAQTQTAQV
ncbi:hypothetical protein Q3G72_012589 [Acer saccharum]|nr:hypothetical protein Q3G72_012589 [Acer saccharum]